MTSFTQMLLSAPPSQLDPIVMMKIQTWGDTPTSLEILEALDMVVHASLGSDFTVTLLNTMLDITLKEEGETYENIVAKAVWRYR